MKMQEYYFLFALAFVWTLLATIQDIRKREVANWLNFSLIAFALAYRTFYSIETKNLNFFLLGVIGFLVFFALANLFYYSRIFAGGDAKLLMAFGIIIPYENYKSIFSLSLIFILALFLLGAIYTLVYSFFLVIKNKKQFKKEFLLIYKKNKIILNLSIIILAFSLLTTPLSRLSLIVSFIALIPIIYVYTNSLDKCMIKLRSPSELTEGDWIEQDIKLSKSLVIKKTVHGLSLKDIKLLKKYRKSVLIKEGIPFIPAFLLTIIFMVFFFLILKHSPASLLSPHF